MRIKDNGFAIASGVNLAATLANLGIDIYRENKYGIDGSYRADTLMKIAIGTTFGLDVAGLTSHNIDATDDATQAIMAMSAVTAVIGMASSAVNMVKARAKFKKLKKFQQYIEQRQLEGFRFKVGILPDNNTLLTIVEDTAAISNAETSEDPDEEVSGHAQPKQSETDAAGENPGDIPGEVLHQWSEVSPPHDDAVVEPDQSEQGV